MARWPKPNPDHFEYARARELRKRSPDSFLAIGGAGVPDIINGNGMLRTMEQTLVDLATDDPAGLLLARRRAEILWALSVRQQSRKIRPSAPAGSTPNRVNVSTCGYSSPTSAKSWASVPRARGTPRARHFE